MRRCACEAGNDTPEDAARQRRQRVAPAAPWRQFIAPEIERRPSRASRAAAAFYGRCPAERGRATERKSDHGPQVAPSPLGRPSSRAWACAHRPLHESQSQNHKPACRHGQARRRALGARDSPGRSGSRLNSGRPRGNRAPFAASASQSLTCASVSGDTSPPAAIFRGLSRKIARNLAATSRRPGEHGAWPSSSLCSACRPRDLPAGRPSVQNVVVHADDRKAAGRRGREMRLAGPPK